MNFGSGQYGQYVCMLIGIYCIFRGVMILVTGKLSEREEARLGEISENGLRKYKMLTAVINIVSGVIVSGVVALRLLNLIDPNVFRIILLAALVVLLVSYVFLRNSCKNTK